MSGTTCDCCGKRVDERSLAIVEDTSQEVLNHYFVCQSCNGYYEPAELLDKIKEAQA
jgi:hypothetical protein